MNSFPSATEFWGSLTRLIAAKMNDREAVHPVIKRQTDKDLTVGEAEVHIC